MHPVHDQFPGQPAGAGAARAGASTSLTYEPFYGLHEKPFSLSADPRFLFRSAAHGSAFDELHAGIRRREGLIVLTGDIGAGKTTLCRAVLQHLDRHTFASFIADPFVSREDLLKTLLLDFGVVSKGEVARGRFNGASRSDLSYPLYDFLDSLVALHGFAVVVIDEAQNLSLPLLEEVRVLSELVHRGKLIQVVLVGQPELRDNLRRPEMRQVAQRVSVCCELGPLDVAGVAGYVQHRLAVAGRGESRVAFSPDAVAAIHVASSGVPRLINRICDRALQRAFTSQAIMVDAECVRAAAEERGLLVAEAPVPPPAAAAVRQELPEAPLTAAPQTVKSAAPALVEPVAPPLVERAAPALVEPSQPSEDSRTLLRQSASTAPSVSHRRWLIAAGACAILLASIGAPAWLIELRALDAQQLAGMMPSRPAPAFRPAALPPPAEPFSLVSLLEGPIAPAKEASVERAIAPKPRNSFAILVASVQERDRAERLVEELVNDGYGAHAVERSTPNGRVMNVLIGGYTSALDVQRDLQRLRQRPGGFADARIVEQD